MGQTSLITDTNPYKNMYDYNSIWSNPRFLHVWLSQFGKQEPGDEAQIKKFISQYGVQFQVDFSCSCTHVQ